jgi:hypothetical protein
MEIHSILQMENLEKPEKENSPIRSIQVKPMIQMEKNFHHLINKKEKAQILAKVEVKKLQ